MMRHTNLALLALAFATTSSSAGELVREFSGNKDATTASFQVESPWIMDWRLDGDFDSIIALDITLVEAKTGRHVGRILHTKYKGNGVKLFQEAGTYQLRVSATLARWRVRIEQLTAEEAKQYSPKRPPKKPFYE